MSTSTDPICKACKKLIQCCNCGEESQANTMDNLHRSILHNALTEKPVPMTTPEARPLFTEKEAQRELLPLIIGIVNEDLSGNVYFNYEKIEPLFRKMLSFVGTEMCAVYLDGKLIYAEPYENTDDDLVDKPVDPAGLHYNKASIIILPLGVE